MSDDGTFRARKDGTVDERLQLTRRALFIGAVATLPEGRMYIPDEIRKCVGFVAMPLANGTARLVGTCFFVGREVDSVGITFTYVVTARHVIDGVRNKGLDRILVRINSRGGDAQWVTTAIKDWMSHPSSLSVDVALLRLAPPEGAEFLIYPTGRFATPEVRAREVIGVGDEVFLVGLFRSHFGKTRNVPLVRVGNIAAMPEEPVDTRLGPAECFLIEARSLGGLSGSPVFANLGIVRILEGHVKMSHGGPIYYLLGLVHGHWDTPGAVGQAMADEFDQPERINVGVAVVVPAEKILEVIEQPAIRIDEERIVKEMLDGRATNPRADA